MKERGDFSELHLCVLVVQTSFLMFIPSQFILTFLQGQITYQKGLEILAINHEGGK